MKLFIAGSVLFLSLCLYGAADEGTVADCSHVKIEEFALQYCRAMGGCLSAARCSYSNNCQLAVILDPSIAPSASCLLFDTIKKAIVNQCERDEGVLQHELATVLYPHLRDALKAHEKKHIVSISLLLEDQFCDFRLESGAARQVQLVAGQEDITLPNADKPSITISVDEWLRRKKEPTTVEVDAPFLCLVQ